MQEIRTGNLESYAPDSLRLVQLRYHAPETDYYRE